jgi:hypothetical protein
MPEGNPYEPPTVTNPIPAVSKLHPLRIPSLAILTAFACQPFMQPDLFLLVLVMLAGNLVAAFILLFLDLNRLAACAFLTFLLLIATALYTNWGFSARPPFVVRIYRPLFIPACVLQSLWLSYPLLPDSFRRVLRHEAKVSG